MATTIDSLALEFQSNSSGAVADIEKLAKALEQIHKSTVTKTAVNNLKSLTDALKGLTPVASNHKKLSDLAESLNKLTAVGSLRGLTNQLKELPEAVKGLSDLNIDESVEKKLSGLARAVRPLSTLKAGGLGSMVEALKNVGEVTDSLDKDTIKAFAKRVELLVSKLKPLSDQMTTVQVGLKGINGAARNAKAGLDKVDTGLDTTSINMSSFVNIVTKAINVIQRLVQKFAEFLDSASEWEGISARFGRGFGSQAQETYEWIQRLNEEMGINVQQFMQYSSTYATMLTGFGVGSEDASKMALGYMELTYDIWAGYNDIYKSMDDAAAAVRSAIAGEVEPVRKAGFTIIESTLEQTAANHGLEISLENATEAQKSYLRYLTLVDQAHAQNLVGTYAAEMDTAEGVMRTFSQQLKSLAQTFGSVFLPTLVEVMPWVQAFVELLGEAIIIVANLAGVEIQEVDFSSSLGDIGTAGEQAQESIDGVNKELEKTEQELKDLKNATLGIDELNVISPSSSSDSADSEYDFSGMIDSLWDESIFDTIQGQVDEIKETLKDWMPVIETIGIGFAGLSIAKLLGDLTAAIEKVDALTKAISGITTSVVEAALVLVFADNYLQEGSLLSLIGEGVATALGGYLLYKTWGLKGLTLGIAVSIAAQLMAITLNLADGGVEMDDLELWLQSAFATATGAVGGGLIFKKWVSTMPHAMGKGMLFGALAALSLSFTAITVGNAADGDLGLTEGITGAVSTVLGGAAGAALCTFLGIATGGTGFLIGAAAMLTVNLIGATVAATQGLKEEITADIAEVLSGSGEFTLEDVTDAVGIKLATITDGFGEFEQYRAIIEGTEKSVRNVATEIDNMAGAIGRSSEAFSEYVPKIINCIETLETETKAKLEAIRNNLIDALAGGLGDGYENVEEYAGVINGLVDATMTRLDELKVILSDTAKMGTSEWYDAWVEYKTLVGEATSLTEDFSDKLGNIDWSGLTTAGGALDTAALKVRFNDITTAFDGTSAEIEAYFSGIDTDLKTLRENAVELNGEGSQEVVMLDSLIDTNQANWEAALGEVEVIAQDTFDQLQADVINKASEVVAKAQAEYKNLGWWGKLLYPTEASYVSAAMSAFKTDYIDPISDEMSRVFEELGIDGEVWAGDAMRTISDALFSFQGNPDGSATITYKDSIASAIIDALNASGQDAKPFALQVAAGVGLDLGNGLGDQYSLIYDETTGAVTGVKDAVSDTVVAMSPDLKAAMEELGINMSNGLATGLEDEEPTLWQEIGQWCLDVLNVMAQSWQIHSPSRKTMELGKHLSDGLGLGMSLTAIRDKLSSMWSTAKEWWDRNVKLSVPSISLKVTYSEATGLQGAVVKALGLDGWPSLEFAKDGGVFDMGSLIWAGEAGAEIVANASGGKTGVMNVDQMQNAVYEGVYAAVTAAMRANRGNGGSQSVNVYLDSRQVTSSVEQRQRERGVSILGNQVYA